MAYLEGRLLICPRVPFTETQCRQCRSCRITHWTIDPETQEAIIGKCVACRRKGRYCSLAGKRFPRLFMNGELIDGIRFARCYDNLHPHRPARYYAGRNQTHGVGRSGDCLVMSDADVVRPTEIIVATIEEEEGTMTTKMMMMMMMMMTMTIATVVMADTDDMTVADPEAEGPGRAVAVAVAVEKEAEGVQGGQRVHQAARSTPTRISDLVLNS